MSSPGPLIRLASHLTHDLAAVTHDLTPQLKQLFGLFRHLTFPAITTFPVIGPVAIIGCVAGVAIWFLWQAKTKESIAAMSDGKGGPRVEDTVECSVFAPPGVAPGDEFKVQVHLHLLKDSTYAWLAALLIDRNADRQALRSLTRPIARGATVHLLLTSEDIIIEQPSRYLRWEGTPAKEVFEAKTRTDLASESVTGIVYVRVDGILVGEIEFKLAVRPARRFETRATTYKTAFVSYSRKDFVQASLYAQGLQLAQIKVLFDVNISNLARNGKRSY
jgi:hypothetical protein